MSKNRSYEDLQVWQKAIFLCKGIYSVTKCFPREEIYGLTSQMRRSAVSIASNIAEGCSRNGSKEFMQFLAVASGSAAELKTQLIIAREIELMLPEQSAPLIGLTDEIERMLTGLSKSVNKKHAVAPFSQLVPRNSQLEITE